MFTVRRLLLQGVSPDSQNEDGLTALHQVLLSRRSCTQPLSFGCVFCYLYGFCCAFVYPVELGGFLMEII